MVRTVETTVGRLMDSSSWKRFMSSRDGKGACFGDSGGPVYIKDNGGYKKVIGATSRGRSYFEAGDGIYTNVGKHKEWLQQAFSELNRFPPHEDIDAPSTEVSHEAPEEGIVNPLLELKIAFEDVSKGSYGNLWVSTDAQKYLYKSLGVFKVCQQRPLILETVKILQGYGKIEW